MLNLQDRPGCNCHGNQENNSMKKCGNLETILNKSLDGDNINFDMDDYAQIQKRADTVGKKWYRHAKQRMMN